MYTTQATNKNYVVEWLFFERVSHALYSNSISNILSSMCTSLVCLSFFLAVTHTTSPSSYPFTFHSITHSFADSCVGLDPITITWTLATNACVFWTNICMSMTSGGGQFWPPGCLTCAICYLQSQITSLQASFPACLLMTALPKYPPLPTHFCPLGGQHIITSYR